MGAQGKYGTLLSLHVFLTAIVWVSSSATRFLAGGHAGWSWFEGEES